MIFSTISSKGQVILPAKARRQLGLKPKDKVIINAVNDTIVIKRVVDFFSLKGSLGKAVSLQDEEQAIMDTAVDRFHGKGRD